MKFIHRLAYYFGGFSLGIILLIFFLSGKKTSCDYGPNARTTKNISKKHKQYSENAEVAMAEYHLDSTIVNDLIRYGTIDFSKSDTQSKPCKTYHVENSFKTQDFKLIVRNCDSVATIQSITLLKHKTQ
ncbi:MAG: hypothetical protein R2812_05690 [Gelidibacter sp.]